MSKYLDKFSFKKKPKDITYNDGEPLNLNEKFSFFHNKNKFRKELNRLQYIFKDFTGNSLVASGIRDTYIKEEFTENNLIILFTDNQMIKNTNEILEANLHKKIESGCYYLTSTSDYLLLIAKDMDGLILGIDLMEELFIQILEHYMEQKKFDEFIKIRPFDAIGCLNS